MRTWKPGIRKSGIIMLALLMMLAPLSSLAENSYYGTVVCETSAAVLAPFGGVVTDLAVKKGMLIRKGEPLCTIKTTKNVSPVSGTVSGVFGEAGDTVDSVKDRFNGVVFIIPEYKFTFTANYKSAEKNSECYVSPGQIVYLEAGKNMAKKRGTGLVSAVSTDSENLGQYTVLITEGPFVLREQISVYRTEDCAKENYLGHGTVMQTAPVVVTGEGTILKMHAKVGDKVSRDTLLFETVSGTPDEAVEDNVIRAETDGIVATSELTEGSSVEKNASLITVYPLDKLQACVTVSETELDNFRPGTNVRLTFETGDAIYDGTVAGISYLAEEAGEGQNGQTNTYASYKVYIDFTATEEVRVGMFVTVEITEAEPETAGEE